MAIRKTLLTAAVLFAVAPVLPALAHDDEYAGYGGHRELHDQLGDAHERAAALQRKSG
jgi:hypothetical protein